MKMKQAFLIVLLSAASAFGGTALYNKINSNRSSSDAIGSLTADGKLPANYARFVENADVAADPIDFTKAASAAVPAVVHIKTKVPARKVTNDLGRNRQSSDDIFDYFFGPGFSPTIIPEQRASGSGVIISEDGYIVTNNHVISNNTGGVVDEVTVTLNDRRVFTAKVIGRDPNSDIAVLKIDATRLPYMIYGNSDDIKLGQWVLAVGYPLTLETTVTAGIVSATGRSIGINKRQVKGSDTPIESFIQTDAAVNQGNSGGALINTAGQLVGINSAILAPNGTYAGYSFAIPVNIAKKIVNDIIQFGDVQRGYLGINYFSTSEDLSEEDLKKMGIPSNLQGVYVSGVTSDGGASAAGIKKGDVITKVNGVPVYSGIQMSAQIASYRPGDKVPVTYVRGGKEYDVTVSLKKRSDVVTANAAKRLGGELSNLPKNRAASFNIEGGVVVNKVNEGGVLKNSRIQPGFIIISVITSEGEQEVTSVDDFNNLLQNLKETSIRVRGIYPDYENSFTYPLNLEQ